MEQVKDQYGDLLWLYRDFKIHREPYVGFTYYHNEFDLEHTGYGYEKTLEAVKEAIDDWYLDQD